MALALVAFALWLRLARLGPAAAARGPVRADLGRALGRPRLRLGNARRARLLGRAGPPARPWPQSSSPPASAPAFHCLALAPPVALMLLWRSEAGGMTGDWFNWERKWDWLMHGAARPLGMVRPRRRSASASLILLWSPCSSRRMTYSRNLAASALFLSLVFVLLPRIVFGSAYADMRLAPYLFAIALVAIRFPERASQRFVSALARRRPRLLPGPHRRRRRSACGSTTAPTTASSPRSTMSRTARGWSASSAAAASSPGR